MFGARPYCSARSPGARVWCALPVRRLPVPEHGGARDARIRPGREPLSYAGGRQSQRELTLSDILDLSELFDDFRDEGRAQLAQLAAALRALDGGAALDEGARAELLRALHTLKGNSAMLGLRPLQELVHAVEDAFKDAPAGDPLPLEALHAAATALERAVDRSGTPEQDDALAALPEIRSTLADALARPAPAAGTLPPERRREDDAAPAAARADTGPRAEDLREDTLRVPFARLDPLLAQVDALSRAVDSLRGWAAARRGALAAGGEWRALSDRLESLETAASAVRRSATSLRLVPVGRVFARFPALAGDLARERGKRVRVELEGEGTELDKSTADALLDPLLHLVRNAVDHGVEPPEARVAAGKPEAATLRLSAAQEGDRVRITVEDDGRGLDRAGILRRARELGLVGPGEEPAFDALAELLFRPGFSTRREVDEISGRGVGLDVVRSEVARLRGQVRVEEGEEGGMRFVLYFPLTVAMVPVLYFHAAGETFAIPALDVEETFRAVVPGRVGPAETVEVRDEALPLVRLDRLFGWEAAPDPRFVLVLRCGTRAAAVGADRLLAQGAATVRALPSALGSPRGVSGVVVDAAGGVVLLLDPEQMLELNLDLYRGGPGGG